VSKNLFVVVVGAGRFSCILVQDLEEEKHANPKLEVGIDQLAVRQ
jgi:hypothetical protein